MHGGLFAVSGMSQPSRADVVLGPSTCHSSFMFITYCMYNDTLVPYRTIIQQSKSRAFASHCGHGRRNGVLGGAASDTSSRTKNNTSSVVTPQTVPILILHIADSATTAFNLE